MKARPDKIIETARFTFTGYFTVNVKSVCCMLGGEHGEEIDASSPNIKYLKEKTFN